MIMLIFSFTDNQVFSLNENSLESSNSTSKSNLNDFYPIVVNQPNYSKSILIYNKTIEAGFVKYEDFPIKITESLHKDLHNVESVGIYDDNIWTKVISNDNSSNNKSQIILRVLGALEPFKPNPYNQTLFVVIKNKTQNQTYVAPIQIVRNSIMNEVFVIHDGVPVKFKNEIFALQNSTLPHIFGIVYDPNYQLPFLDSKHSLSSIHVDIEPVGIINNTTITAIPPWLQITPLQLPLSLTQEQPDYFAFLISTKNAPKGSYEIALRENISGKIFIETIVLTILG